MSAYILDKAQIDALVLTAWLGPQSDRFQPNPAACGRWDGMSMEEAERLGALLIAENIKSINYRYPDTIDNPEDMPGPIDKSYLFQPYQTPNAMTFRRPTAMQAIKLVQCYEYQTCEHPGWKTSEAREFCQSFIADLISMLPGYNDAEWKA